MTAERKTSEVRKKELVMAILRIQKGRSRIGEVDLTVAAVAREAGVSTSLIHNYHPEIADRINQATGRSSRKRLDAKQEQLKVEKHKSRALRAELAELKEKLTRIASINEVLSHENGRLKVQLSDPKVVGIRDQQ